MGRKIVSGIILFFIIWGLIGLIPKYPKINPNQQYEQVIKQIKNIVMENIKKASFEYMDDTRKLLNMKKDFEKYAIRSQKCKKDTRCLVDAYNDYMDDNVASSTRKIYRYFYIEKKFGKLGILINNAFKELY